jgi:ribosomal protein S18 acetylase RimI-like enzyme
MDDVREVAEFAAAGLWAQFAAVPEDVREHLGLAVTQIGDVVVVSTREDPTHYWSKALGFTGPVTAELIARIAEFYRSEGCAQAGLQILPELLPPDWDEICAANNLVAGSKLARLACAAVRDTGSTDLRIAPIVDFEEWISVTFTAFGMTGGFAPALIALAADPHYRSFGAWDSEKLVGVGSVYIRDGIGYLNTGATLPEYRNRGIQSALIGVRAKEAADCRLLVSDTSAEPNPSLGNLLRAGFEQVGQPIEWVWKP